MNKKFIQKIEKGAEIRAKNDISEKDTNSQKTLFVIEQVHHSYAPQSSTKESFEEFTKKVNDLQNCIFNTLQDLNNCGLDLLGIEDISYKDQKEVDKNEATEMVKRSKAGTISTWHYEINFPKHYKTFCPDIINIGGMRKAVAFAGAKLLGQKEALEKQKSYFESFFEEHLINLSKDEKESLWEHVLDYKKKQPGISETSLFLSLVINSQVQGFIEGLGEYYGASAITAFLKKHIKNDYSQQKDQTEGFFLSIQGQFTDLVKELFSKADQEADFDLMCQTFIKFMAQVFNEAIAASSDVETLLSEERSKIVVENCIKIMDQEKESNMVIVFGAAHSDAILKKCTKEGVNCFIIRPKHEIWEEIGL